MKYLSVLLFSLVLFSCQDNKEIDYVNFRGTIVNMNSDSLKIYNKTYSKVITVNDDGSFADTLHLNTPGFYTLFDGGEYARLFLKNGYDVTMSLDTEKFDESISFSGVGAEHSSFLAKKGLMEQNVLDIDIDQHDSVSLQNKLNDASITLNEFVASQQGLDTMLTNKVSKDISSLINNYGRYYGDLIKLREDLPEGAVSPVFNDYENHAGGTTSLSDLKGKYVYVDVWATWCGPCKQEIPFLKEIEKEYHDKNIHFVSISIDEQEDHAKWVAMVNEKSLGGIQLFADNDWKSQFVQDYYIKGIPRFLLIDPEGNVVSPDAPRPSSPKLREKLDALL